MLWLLFVPALILAVLKALALHSAANPPPLGLTADGQLRPCPDSPNCAATAAGDLSPLPYGGTANDARQRLRSIVESTPRWRLVDEQPTYWRIEATTRFMGFVDDVEILFDDAAGVVRLRSASRVGYSDFGANRRRLSTLRERWLAD